MASNASRSPRRFRRPTGFLVSSLMAVALAAGLAVTSGCGGSSNKNAESAMAKLLDIGQSPGTTSQVLFGKLPADLPDGLPEYPGSSLVGSTITTSGAATSLGVLRESGDPVDKVYAFYEQALDVNPWEIQISSFPTQTAGVQFGNINDSNVAGAVVIQSSGDDKSDSLIFLSIQKANATATSEPFKLEPSKPLPRDWPSQVPLYPNATITGTAWGRTVGASEWQISFLAQTTPTDVIDFYRTELSNTGFVVKDEAPQGEAAVISFTNQQTTQTWNGGVSAQTFADDPSYAQATVQLSIGAAGATQPSGTPTP